MNGRKQATSSSPGGKSFSSPIHERGQFIHETNDIAPRAFGMFARKDFAERLAGLFFDPGEQRLIGNDRIDAFAAGYFDRVLAAGLDEQRQRDERDRREHAP